MADEIIEELWKIKNDIAEEYGRDVKALATHLREKRHEEERQVVDLRFLRQTDEQKAQESKNQVGNTAPT